MPTLADITATIDTAIRDGEQELERLRRARAAIADATQNPAPAPPAPSRTPVTPANARKAHGKDKHPRQPKLTLEDALDPVRDAIADQPRTVHQICGAIGRVPSVNVKNVVRQVLEQLGATLTTSGWTVQQHEEPDPPPGVEAPESPNGVHQPDPGELEAAYLERRLLATLEDGLFTSELLAQRLDAGTEDIKDACHRLEREGHCRRTADGMWTAA